MKINIYPRAVSPAGAIQNGAECSINRMVVFAVNDLPIPRHGGADGTAERTTPDAFAPAAQIEIIGAVPTSPVGAEFSDHHRFAVTLQKGLRDPGQLSGRPKLSLGVISRKVELRQ